MFVKMLTAMAGDAFSYDHSQVVEVSSKIGKAWVAAGLAEETKPIDVLEAEATKHAGAAKEAVTKLKVAQVEVVTVKADLSAVQDALKASADQLAQAHAANGALLAEIDDLKAQLAAAKEATLTALEDLDEARSAASALAAEMVALKADAQQGQG